MKFCSLFTVLTLFFGPSMSFRLNSGSINSDRIIDGETAKRGQFPHQVSLRFKLTEHFHRCGGSIISDRWILTAAHCTLREYGNLTNSVIVVGAHNVSGNGNDSGKFDGDGISYDLRRIVKHPKFVYGIVGMNDLSLLQTSKAIQFNQFIKPIPIRKRFLDSGATVTVSGWGLVESWPRIIKAELLRFFDLKTITNEDCRARLKPPASDRVNNRILCAFSEKEQGVCIGDEGNPVISNGQLVGVVGWMGLCASGVPDQYTRISTYLKWIEDVSGVAAA